MTDDYEDEDSVFIALNFETRLVRVLDSLLIPSRMRIKTDLNPREDASDEELQAAITKIKYFFEHVVSRCVAFASDNESAIDMIIDDEGRNRTSNLLMMTPGEPTDEMMAALFQTKMTALSNGAVNFGFVEISSDNSLGMTFTFVGEGTRILPDNKSWIGERSYFDVPWWGRNDASTLDILPPEDADLDEKPAWAFSLDPLVQPKQEPGIIVRPEFRPTVIDGGKKTDE